MDKLEKKISRLQLKLAGLGMGTVIVVSAVILAFMQNTGSRTFGKMSAQAAAGSQEILTGEMNAQAAKYGDGMAKVMEEKLGQTEAGMEVIAGGIADIYEKPEMYAPVAFPNAGRLKGSDKRLHWLLPQAGEPEGAQRDELYRLYYLKPYFQAISEKNGQLLRIFFSSQSGVNVGYDGDYEKKPPVFEGRDTLWYKAAVKKKGPAVSEAYTDSFVDRLIVTFSLPCYGKDGRLLGVLAADVLIDDLEGLMQGISLEFDGYAMLMSQKGSMVAAKGMNRENAHSPEKFLGSSYRQIQQAVESGGKKILESTIGGREKYVIHSEMKTADFSLIIVLDKEAFAKAARTGQRELMKTAQKSRHTMAVSMAAACILWAMAVLALFLFVLWQSKKLSEKISGPIVKLTREVKKIGTGSLLYQPDIHTNDEIEELSRAFGGMTVSLKEYIENLSGMTAEKERLCAELDVATQIQVSMLPCIFPAFPEREDMDIYASMHTAKEVGGDFYDFFFVDESHLCMIMADVSGKGVPAALFMVVAKTLLKDSMTLGLGLKDVFERVNEGLCKNNQAGMFVTAFAACVNLEDGSVRFVNAGHNPPLLFSGQDTAKGRWMKDKGGFVLAALEGTRYEEGKFDMEPGDLLFLYTDGVTEAQNEENRLYGDEALVKFLESINAPALEAEEAVYMTGAQITRFQGRAEQADDMTMLAFAYRPDKAPGYLKVEARKENLCLVNEYLEHKLGEAGCSRCDVYRVLICGEEIFTNIAQYAYPCSEKEREMGESGTADIQCLVNKDSITLIFRDRGIAYNPLENPEPDLEMKALERPVGGLGIHLVKSSMDEVRYGRKSGQNILTCIKLRK